MDIIKHPRTALRSLFSPKKVPEGGDKGFNMSNVGVRLHIQDRYVSPCSIPFFLVYFLWFNWLESVKK